MTLVTGSHSKKFKIQLFLLLFITFIIYCVYEISSNTPTVNQLENTASIDTPSGIDKPADTVAEEQVIEEEVKVVKQAPNVCMTDKVLRNIDPNHTNAHYGFWYHLSENTIETYKKRWQDFISSIEMPSHEMKGQGIVFVAGNRDTFQRAITSIKLLRKYNCTLDIEVWHLHDEQPTKKIQKELTLLNAVPKDLSDSSLARPMIGRRNAEKQFQIKAAAVINSAFKEVLYLDSDNIPASDPTFLFDTPGYKDTGALFWPDFWKTHGQNRIFDILDITCKDEWEQESGQMVIDKEKSWLPLQLAWYMQKNHEVYFQFLNGDKDTFKYAWQALDVAYHMTEPFVGMAGTMTNGRFCGHTMLQYDQDDKLLFVHANLLKITDKTHFTENHPWDLAKHSSMSRGNTYIKPEFYISPLGQACMDFTHRQGEPDAITEDFDEVLPNFQKDYFGFGGIGGETRA